MTVDSDSDSSSSRSIAEKGISAGAQVGILLKRCCIAIDKFAEALAASGNMSIMDACKSVYGALRGQYDSFGEAAAYDSSTVQQNTSRERERGQHRRNR